ncbi:MAG: 4-(cytidine 5'-diphospho)-2-C-methyl-D-erythritol kinase, partial [Oscillospiraceae bacterium]|nr:4-(cytidine 5'-diphospho)-2-C-methyl-D-erythritol kinase [Oscillospiraceae bacterium]
IVAALRAGRLADVACLMYNVFEDVSPHRAEIARIKAHLIELGALGAVMTGTGSAVFGVFASASAARAAYGAAQAARRAVAGDCYFFCEVL